MLIRERYLKKIRPFYHDTGMIKVIEGMRRSGKSVILGQIQDELISLGVAKGQIVYLNLEKRGFRKIRTDDELDELIASSMPKGNETVYLFIDEIQRVEGFERVIEGWRLEENVSIFITGSNSYLLSGELATHLTGRYLSFFVYPFSFSEAYEYGKLAGNTLEEKLLDYFTYGGLPKRFDYSGEGVASYVSSVISEILHKDLLGKVRDRTLFMRILSYLALNSGVEVSYTKIANTLKSQGVKTTRKTVSRYIELLEKAKLIILLPSEFLKGRSALSPHEKAYVTDFGLSYFASPIQKTDWSSKVETVVHNELNSRGYDVARGLLRNGEIDFVAGKNRKRIYIQATYIMGEGTTIEREFEPLYRLMDASPKYVVSLDPIEQSQKGVINLHLIRGFLLDSKWEITNDNS